MRIALLSLLLIACGDDPKPQSDASTTLVDAKPLDAAVDAPPDAPNLAVACMHVCDALAACFGEPPNPECYGGCTTDLADCTDQQVAAIDACSSEECGDIESGDSPLANCVSQVACVDMAMSRPRR